MVKMKNSFHTTLTHNNSMFRAHGILTLWTGNLMVLIITCITLFRFIPVILHFTCDKSFFFSVGFDNWMQCVSRFQQILKKMSNSPIHLLILTNLETESRLRISSRFNMWIKINCTGTRIKKLTFLETLNLFQKSK
jgi:hypothetical protein